MNTVLEKLQYIETLTAEINFTISSIQKEMDFTESDYGDYSDIITRFKDGQKNAIETYYALAEEGLISKSLEPQTLESSDLELE